jgi:hypothetical protein
MEGYCPDCGETDCVCSGSSSLARAQDLLDEMTAGRRSRVAELEAEIALMRPVVEAARARVRQQEAIRADVRRLQEAAAEARRTGKPGRPPAPTVYSDDRPYLAMEQAVYKLERAEVRRAKGQKR